MVFWAVGLATQASAERACKWGGIACLFQVARLTISNIASVSVANKPFDNAIAWFVGASLFPIFLLVAGIRLWRHNGWVWGSLAALLIAFDLIVAMVAPTARTMNAYVPFMTKLTAYPSEAAQVAVVAGIAIKGAILALVVNGVRGALALRTLEYPTDMRGAFS